MKIALLSDIHANLPALEAALQNIDSHNPDAIYCLGDLVGYNVWPNEVVHIIQNRKIATLAGNHDLKVRRSDTTVGENGADITGKDFAYAIVGNKEKEYLLTLPSYIRLQFQFNGTRINLLLVHGSPRSVNEYLLEDMDEALLLEIMHEADADILCFGHSHKPYHRIVNVTEDGRKVSRHAINIGSVGKPKDNNPKGCYVLLTMSNNAGLEENAGLLKVEFIRFEYDVEKAAKAVENSPLPDELADMLRFGY